MKVIALLRHERDRLQEFPGNAFQHHRNPQLDNIDVRYQKGLK